jgi:predicted amidohydrolase YtcJ
MNTQFLYAMITWFYGLLILSGCSLPSTQADIIMFGGKIITVDNNFSIHEAVAINDGKILAVGKNDEIFRLAGSDTKQINLNGKTVIPGINEGHVHPISASQSEYIQPIPDIHSIQELLGWIQREAAGKVAGEWIIHPKFFATRMLEMRQPTKLELDSVAPDHPVFLDGSYGGMINSQALKVSGIGPDSHHPGILKDKHTGEPTGIIRGSAFDLLALPENHELSQKHQLKLLKEMLQLYNEVGITSICVGSGSPEDLQLFRTLKEKGALTVRVFQNMYIPFDPHATLNEMQTVLSNFDYSTGDGDEWVRVGALKTRVDGGILTGTARLRQPWGVNASQIYGITDPEYRGIAFLSKKELTRIASVANEFGWKFTAHITGGGGVDLFLEAMEEVNNVSPIHHKRFSIIHGNFYTSEAIHKMAQMGIYADMQPAWFYKDADLLSHVLGEETTNTFHPYKSLFEAGVVINGGSDHMVKLDSYTSINPYNPFVAIWSVVTRKTERRHIYAAQEAISREQALKMYTINNAYASFEEDIKGTIEGGKLADLIVLSEDILTCPEEHIKDIKVLLTMVNGKVVYERDL